MLYRNLFEAFDKVDGKPSKKELAKKQKEEEAAKNAAKQKEIEELQVRCKKCSDDVTVSIMRSDLFR